MSEEPNVTAAYTPSLRNDSAYKSPDKVTPQMDTPKWLATLDEIVSAGFYDHDLSPQKLRDRPIIGIRYDASKEAPKRYLVSERLMKAIEAVQEGSDPRADFP